MSDTGMAMEDLEAALEALITAAQEGGLDDEEIVIVLTRTAEVLRDGMS